MVDQKAALPLAPFHAQMHEKTTVHAQRMKTADLSYSIRHLSVLCPAWHGENWLPHYHGLRPVGV